MSIALAQRSFFLHPLPSTHFPIRRKFLTSVTSTISCRSPSDNRDGDSPRRKENGLAKLAIVTLAAGVLTLGSVHEASAAKTGGRVGGQAFRSAPRVSSPRINNSRTNIYINPPVAPPLVGGYGFGYGVPYYGGWGWSPFSFFAPGPGVAVGIGGGFEVLAFFMLIGAVAAAIRRFAATKDEEDEF